MNKAAVLALSITAALALPHPARSQDDPPPPRLEFAFEEAVRTQPRFEAPIGKYDWLNRGAFIGTLEMATDVEGPAVRIRFYKAV
jgi:hypothetical protein